MPSAATRDFLEDSPRYLLNAAGDTEAMHGFKAERFENQHIQRALNYICVDSSMDLRTTMIWLSVALSPHCQDVMFNW